MSTFIEARHDAIVSIEVITFVARMELPIQKCRTSLQGCVDPLLTVGTARRVSQVDNTDDRHTAADRQHWMGVKPLKHRLSSLLSDLPYTTNDALQQD